MVPKYTKQMVSVIAIALVAGCSAQPNATRLDTPFVMSHGKVARLDAGFKRAVDGVVHFGFDQDTLTDEAQALLDKQADWILSNPDLMFSVTGHTDKVGSIEYNSELGMRRAQRVLGYLVGKGVQEERLIAMVSMGEEKPVIDTEDRELANRRVTTDVIGFVPVAQPRWNGSDDDRNRIARNGPASVSSETPGQPETPSEPGDQSGPQTPPAAPQAPSNPQTPSDPQTPSNPQPPADPQTPSGPQTPTDPQTPSDPQPPSGPTEPGPGKGKDHDKKPNAGRGNGDEGGDPGNSADHNQGGDEEPAA